MPVASIPGGQAPPTTATAPRRLKRFVSAMGCAVGLHHALRRINRRRLLIVCYHGVAEPSDPPAWLLMPGAAFERQLNYLRSHYRLLPIDDALQELWAGRIRTPTACITFDDGYLNNLTEALPRLARARAPATVYLATGLIGTERLLWTTELDLAMAACRASAIQVDGVVSETSVPARSADRAVLAERLKERLKALPARLRRPAHAALLASVGRASDTDGRPFRMLSWDDVRQMEDTGMVKFGGHTVNHEIVSRLDDLELEQEIGGSIRTVQAHVEQATATFAYPNGRPVDFDQRAAAAAAAAGCVAAVSTIEGLNDASTDRFALRRVTLGADIEFDEFRLRTAGLHRRRVARAET